jgi:GntR family transcriptional regulator
MGTVRGNAFSLARLDRRRDVARRLRDILNTRLTQLTEQRLPADESTMVHFGVSRNGVRHALQLLADENRIERNVGAGSFLRAIPSRHVSDLLRDFTDLAQEQPLPATADVVGFRLLDDVPEGLREVFSLLPDVSTVAVFERRSIRGGIVRGLHTYYLPLRAGETMVKEQAAGDVYKFIETTLGRTIYSAERAVSAVAADESSAALLKTSVGAPLLFTESIVRDDEGRVQLVIYARHLHDQLTLTFSARRTSPNVDESSGTEDAY